MNMIMKQLNFKFIAAAFALLFALPAFSQQAPLEDYERRVYHYHKAWDALIPRYTKVQYAGGMGLMSVGVGWDYGKSRQWETDLLFGLIAKNSSQSAKVTMTMKQNYIPWSVSLGSRWAFEPLETGIYFNTVFSNKFWTKEPGRYPSGYYGFSTRIRTHIFIGQRWQYDIPNSKHKFAKSITGFYELSSCDLYIVSAATNKYLKPKDYLRLSFGIKLQIL
jgi:hypothetical protein